MACVCNGGSCAGMNERSKKVYAAGRGCLHLETQLWIICMDQRNSAVQGIKLLQQRKIILFLEIVSVGLFFLWPVSLRGLGGWL